MRKSKYDMINMDEAFRLLDEACEKRKSLDVVEIDI